MDERGGLPGIPSSWTWAEVGDLAGNSGALQDGDWILSKNMNPDGEVRLIQLADIGAGAFLDKSDKHLTLSRALELGCSFLESGDILISRMAHPLARACRVPSLSYKSITAVDVAILRPDGEFFDANYSTWLLNTQLIQRQAEVLSSGTTRKRISRKNLERLRCPIPPLPEQGRIVAKIEKLFSQLDAGVEALQEVKALLKQYRQSVLKHAFEGKLTEKWREAHKDELEPASVLLKRMQKEGKEEKGRGRTKELAPPDTTELPTLPFGWKWVRLDDICNVLLGQSPPSSTYNETGEGLPFFQGKREFGELYPNVQKWCSEPRKVAQEGDVLISVRAPVGPTNICPEIACIGRGLAALRGLGDIRSLYILYAIRAFENEIAGKGTGTTFKAITGGRLRNIGLPLSPLAEQSVIVQEIERHLSISRAIEQSVESSLVRANRTRASVLKRAFEGKLVPQDPTDEPTEKLLERIGEDKQKRAVKRQGRRRRTKKDTA